MEGTVKLPGFTEEVFTQGLDKLGKRLLEYKELGATLQSGERYIVWTKICHLRQSLQEIPLPLRNMHHSFRKLAWFPLLNRKY